MEETEREREEIVDSTLDVPHDVEFSSFTGLLIP